MSKIISSKVVLTRKPHICFGCRKEYSSGTYMKRDVMLDSGIFVLYVCETCEEIIQMHFQDGDKYSEGEIYNNDREYWEEVNREVTINYEP